ncbi:class I lanthipeptide [uncultured Psychroserpens sp.]|uniref:class I lanthipeptide n=1 Tax=uncultured Psychroserpens sp. TaxID=255436 RepID=UPI002637B093|nr:class I lanthipeptide [uncultured Psychroserpens sp.]
MKKIKFNTTLRLSKEVVTRLQDHQLSNVKGGMGAAGSCFLHTCNTATKKEKEKEEV